ncbi:MAG: 16S rRNA (adenine(1518)-N(6)/adenine(1519)-N(6))-dimethyltransferase RsmA [Lachnospiraceae bacterium]|nr:16S rRNA (adenine(1518)-N(6)/adenine(1519)-N(6))-dimethyltransferase RsmA [Lachnospiraceae bacterium]
MQPFLADPNKTKELLARHDFLIKKGYGQNFLIDPSVPAGIAAAAGLGPEDTVLEIGPGIGTLTQVLAAAAGRVIAVEIDRKLEPVLADSLRGFDNVTVVWGDILKQDIPRLLAEHGVTPPVKVVANLPYYITSPILMALLKQAELFSSLTVMVQAEVGERMAAAPGTKEYGYLSVSVQYYAQPRLVLSVPPHAFLPQPKVSSAVVRLETGGGPAVQCRDADHLFAVAKAAFLQRRKTLANALAGYAPLGVSRDQAEAALTQTGLDPRIRGERLSLAQFAALSDILWAMTHQDDKEQKETSS